MNFFTTFIQPSLQFTFVDHVINLKDAFLIVEACFFEAMYHIYWFSRQDELQGLVDSGNTYVYAKILIDKRDWDHDQTWMILGREDGIFIQRERYEFDSLFKKSESFIVQGIRHSIVFYYKMEGTVRQLFKDRNVLNETMKRSFEDLRLEGISLRQELVSLFLNSS